MVISPTENVRWISASDQPGPAGPTSALSKIQPRWMVRAAALPWPTKASNRARSSSSSLTTYFLFIAAILLLGQNADAQL
jgi:hypothetical protein